MNNSTHSRSLVAKAFRLLPAGLPGKSRLAKRVLHSSLGSEDVTVLSREGFNIVVPSLREPIGFHLLVDGVYELASIEFILDSLQPGSTFVDVGANVGAFTLPAARRVGPSGCVVAIEPSAAVYPYLQRNVAASGLNNIHLVNLAAYDNDNTCMPFYDAPKDHFGMGSLGKQFSERPAMVQTRRLDSILSDAQMERVDLIKVDVEGFEAAVFEGASQLLSRCDAPVVLFEFCDWAEARMPNVEVGAAQRRIRECGYRLWRLPDFIKGLPSMNQVLLEGSAMLVARK